MADVVVIGKNSFLASALHGRQETQGWLFLSHQDIQAHREAIERARVLINFSLHPDLINDAYDRAKDIDAHLASLMGPDTHYVMISTRMVYGAPIRDAVEFYEGDPCTPLSVYGKNKHQIEKNLQALLPEKRLTILRLSNIFGLEPGRKTFFGTMMSALKKDGVIRFEISLASVRDFLPIDVFAQRLIEVARAPRAGVYNMGSGQPVSCGEAVQWLIEGYGAGESISTNDARSGEFVLNMDRANAAYDFSPLSKESIRRSVFDCGVWLRSFMDDRA